MVAAILETHEEQFFSAAALPRRKDSLPASDSFDSSRPTLSAVLHFHAMTKVIDSIVCYCSHALILPEK